MALPAVSLGESLRRVRYSSFVTQFSFISSSIKQNNTETLPPGSPRNGGSPPTGPQPPRTSSRGSQNSPSSGECRVAVSARIARMTTLIVVFWWWKITKTSMLFFSFFFSTLIGSSNGRRSSGSRHVSSTTVSSTEAQSQSNNNATVNNVQPPLLATTGQQPTDVSNVPAPAPPVNPTLKCKLSKTLALLLCELEGKRKTYTNKRS